MSLLAAFSSRALHSEALMISSWWRCTARRKTWHGREGWAGCQWNVPYIWHKIPQIPNQSSNWFLWDCWWIGYLVANTRLLNYLKMGRGNTSIGEAWSPWFQWPIFTDSFSFWRFKTESLFVHVGTIMAGCSHKLFTKSKNQQYSL